MTEAYRTILERHPDEDGLRGYVARLTAGEIDIRDVYLDMFSSPERGERRAALPPVGLPGRGTVEEGAIDVRQLLAEYTVDQLSETAEEYFRSNANNPTYFLSKPVFSVDEAPDHLVCIAEMLAVLRPLPGMRVLDFGAGTCWTSRMLTQLGCAVVASDVSPTALEIGKRLYAELPPIGKVPAPEFQVFDGFRLDLPDASIDRILCFDAFHHVPNQEQVLAEFRRVLVDGGMVGLSEPGPQHSLTGQSQFEMRNYTVIENDMVMPEIAQRAAAAGFESVEMALFHVEPLILSLDEYADFVEGGPTSGRYANHVRNFAANRYNFFLRAGEASGSDSRDRRGLGGTLTVDLETTEVVAGEPIRGSYSATNTGENAWLPSDADHGPVRIGVHRNDSDDHLVDRDYARVFFPYRESLPPGETVEGSFELPAVEPGAHRLVFDLVAEFVCWFEVVGHPVTTIDVVAHPSS